MFGMKKKNGLIANVIKDKCRNCGYCMRVCPHKALGSEMVNGKACTFVNRPTQCTGCRRCVLRCPEQAIELIARNVEPPISSPLYLSRFLNSVIWSDIVYAGL